MKNRFNFEQTYNYQIRYCFSYILHLLFLQKNNNAKRN